MSVIGSPCEWADLIDPMIPEVLRLVVVTWRTMSPPLPDAKEDEITTALCRALRDNRTARELMFTIDTQLVELDPVPGEDLGRLDIAFRPLIPREDIYFCLECKRLNVVNKGQTRAYAAEYVLRGMIRFVTGQYSRAVRHGGMLGYVLDGRVDDAIANVSVNVQAQCGPLCMDQPGTMHPSSILTEEISARETVHRRSHESVEFRIHHLFMGAAAASVTAA